METIRALIRGDLPPVGNPIAHFPARASNLPIFHGYTSSWVDSGTSALALAFLAAKQLRGHLTEPEVILPGYCCPDLLSAAHYAGVKPVLVDINKDDPSLQLRSVREAISANTLAIVAINFLGVSEDLDELMGLKKDFPNIFIVEDNAQWFPNEDEHRFLRGDFVTFSFGRGKPVSLLGGGLLLGKQDVCSTVDLDSFVAPAHPNLIKMWVHKTKLIAYNSLLKPFFYQMISRNPFIKVGATEYHKLEVISSLDSFRRGLLRSNLKLYECRNDAISKSYDQLLKDVGFENNFTALSTRRRKKLLRYPVLFTSVEQKQKVFEALTAAGLGATEMYRLPLPDIYGVYGFSVKGRLEHAESFAARFISLPVHQGVTPVHLAMVRTVFKNALA